MSAVLSWPLGSCHQSKEDLIAWCVTVQRGASGAEIVGLSPSSGKQSQHVDLELE